MNSTYDRWGPFCQAAKDYEAKLLGNKIVAAEAKTLMQRLGKRKLHPMACSKRLRVDTAASEPLLNEELLVQKNDDALVWADRYFETQEEMKCGKHALNNIMGGPQFTDEDVALACNSVVEEVSEPRHLHASASGWYSFSVLARLLHQTSPCLHSLNDRPVEPDAYERLQKDPDFKGVLINQKNKHWAAICPEKGVFFYVDSRFFPTRISSQDFHEIVTKHPMSFEIRLCYGKPPAQDPYTPVVLD